MFDCNVVNCKIFPLPLSSALEYEGGSSNDGRATPKTDHYNPQFLHNYDPQVLNDETYLDVWGDVYKRWFRSTGEDRKSGKKKKKGEEKEEKVKRGKGGAARKESGKKESEA